jgi:hypothetical protein
MIAANLPCLWLEGMGGPRKYANASLGMAFQPSAQGRLPIMNRRLVIPNAGVDRPCTGGALRGEEGQGIAESSMGTA